MRVRISLCLVVVVATLTGGVHADIRVCTWNLLQFTSSSINGDTARINAFKLVLTEVDADILIVQEISNDAAVALLRDQILNAAGGPGGGVGTDAHYTAATFSDTASGLDAALFYRDSLFSEVPASYLLLNTSPRDTPRWRLRPVGEPTDVSDLYVYSMHLSSADPVSRAAQTLIARTDANGLPADSNFIYAGDFNIDSSGESSYQNLVGSQANNNGRAFDPINRPGSWGNSSGFADIHTQSPHLDNAGGPSGAAGGGMDDRFDFLLRSSSLDDAVGIDYLPGTYRTFGNDGLHFNKDINDSPVIPEGAAVADALHAASDHMPVIMDLSDPVSAPVIELTPPSILFFPLALVGGTSLADLTVTNTATLPAENLEYSFTPPPDFLVPAGNFIALAGGPGVLHSLALETLTSGNKQSLLEVVNNSGNSSPIETVLLSGAVLDHAVPSVTPMNQVTNGMIEITTAGGSLVDANARVYNADFAEFLSVPLSITQGSITNDVSGRFSLVGFVPVNGITDFADFTVRFDGVGAGSGNYTADLVFECEDDSVLSGAMMLDDVMFSLSATIPGPLLGDFNLNGVVEPGDIPGMVALQLDPLGSSAQDQVIGDMNQDAVNDAADLQLFIDAMAP